jgi:hypothetical protein
MVRDVLYSTFTDVNYYDMKVKEPLLGSMVWVNIMKYYSIVHCYSSFRIFEDRCCKELSENFDNIYTIICVRSLY